MSVLSWKKSGWINTTLGACLILAVITGICSSGIRTRFRIIKTNFRFEGGLEPEIGLFNILLYFSALFGFMCVSYRYSYFKDQNRVMSPAIEYLNKTSAVTGVLSFLGLILIASFPVSYENEATPFQSSGAYVFIGGGLAFIVLQTFLTYVIIKYTPMLFIRLILAILLMSSFISSLILIQMHREGNKFQNTTLAHDNVTEVTDVGEANDEQLAAYVLKWACVVLYALYFISFFRDFQNVSSYVIVRPLIVPTVNDLRSSSLTVIERI